MLEYNLEQYREVRINGVVVPGELLLGAVTLSIEEGGHVVLSFTLRNDEDAIPGVLTPPVTPVQKTFSMIGQTVEFIGGYRVDHRKLFSGIIYNSQPSYPDGGLVTLTLEAKSLSYNLSNAKRTEVYPVNYREDPPTSDGTTAARPVLVGDNRSWAIREVGQAIGLNDIIEGIVLEAGLEIGQIETSKRDAASGDPSAPIREITFDGIERVLHQAEMTDWEFLNFLARKYHCVMWVDDDGKFYFLSRESLKNEEIANVPIIDQGARKVRGIHFYYNRRTKRPRYLSPLKEYAPWSPNTVLSLSGINFQINVDNLRGGFVQTHTDIDGNLVLTSTQVDDEGKLGFERLTLRRELLTTPEADEFIANFQLGETGWEETKKFWKERADVELVDASETRNNPAFYQGPTFSATVQGCIHIKPFSSYYFYNLGFGIDQDTNLDRYKGNIISVTHEFGESFKTQIEVRIW